LLRHARVAAKPHWRFIDLGALGVNSLLTKTTKLPLFVNDFDKVRPNRRRHPERSFDNAKLIRFEKDATTMTAINDLTGQVGFATPITEKSFAKRRRLGVELFATLALAVSLMIAATAVSIGMARAQTFRAATPCCSTTESAASFLGGVIAEQTLR
jgi:hypothetical protein